MTQAIPAGLSKPEACNANETTPLLPPPGPAPPSQPTELTGYLYMAVSCIGFSAMSFFVHIAEDRYNFPARSSIFIRGTFHALLSILYIIFCLPFPRIFTNVSARQWKLLALRGLAGAFGIFMFFTALQKLHVGDAVTLFFCGPVIVIILSHIFLNEPITPIDTIAGVTSFIGVVLIARPDVSALATDSVQQRFIGVIAGLSAAFFSSVAYVTIRSMGARVHFMLSVFIFGCATLLISILLGGALGPKGLLASKEGSMLIALSSLCAFAGQCYLTKGLQLCRAGPGVLIRNLDVPIAYILGILFLAESPTLLRLFGSVLVLSAAVMIGVRQLIRC